jgi:hypothetical protein
MEAQKDKRTPDERLMAVLMAFVDFALAHPALNGPSRAAFRRPSFNLLRSATGRAYMAFYSESERQAMLKRLAASSEPGNFMARKPAMTACR